MMKNSLTYDEINAWYSMIDKFRELLIEEIHMKQDGTIKLVGQDLWDCDPQDRQVIAWYIGQYAENGYRHPEDDVVVDSVVDGVSIVMPWAADDEWRETWKKNVGEAAKREIERMVGRS